MLVQRQNSKRIRSMLITGGILMLLAVGYIIYINLGGSAVSPVTQTAKKNVPKDFGQSLFTDSRYLALLPTPGTQLIQQANQVLAPDLLPAPTGVQAFDTREGGTALFTWKRPAGSESANIIRLNVVRGTERTNVVTLPASTTSYLYHGAKDGVAITYELHYVAQQVLFPTGAQAVRAVTGAIAGPLRVTLADTSGVRLAWDSPAQVAAKSIEVYRSDAVGSLGALVARLDAADTSYVDPAGKPELSFYTALWIGDSTAGNVWTGPVTTSDTTAPQAPQSIRAELLNTAKGDTVRVTWAPSASTDVVKYLLFRATAALSLGTLLQTYTVQPQDLAQEKFFLDDATVQHGTSYYYTVVAIDAAGNPSSTQDLGIAGHDNPFVAL